MMLLLLAVGWLLLLLLLLLLLAAATEVYNPRMIPCESYVHAACIALGRWRLSSLCTATYAES